MRISCCLLSLPVHDLFAYCGNNPVNLYDPSGFASIVYDPGPNPELAMDYEYWARKAAGYYDNSTTSLLYFMLVGAITSDPEAVPTPAPSPPPSHAWPVSSSSITLEFWEYDNEFYYINDPHHGIDFSADVGTPVTSITGGNVIFADYSGDFGNLVIVQLYEDGPTVYYAHLSFIAVREGDPVAMGSPIGLSGNTGKSGAPHLHLAMKQNDWWIDPYPYLPPYNRGSYNVGYNRP